ncbi:MAG TPA: histidine kinase dimerization/phospho-acceptor domain-containing protein, partial [Polyangia bacterium]|nr:histidine kinase dimerization/phospho-acceptor domain-containing protein [Polyangia bacterium]
MEGRHQAMEARRTKTGTHGVPLTPIKGIEGERLLKTETPEPRLTLDRQSQLVQRDQLANLGRLVAGVAHELTNPLAAVSGMLDLMKEIVGERQQLGPHEIQLLREMIVDC